MARLTKIEKETIVLFNEGEDNTFTACSGVLIDSSLNNGDSCTKRIDT